MAGANGDLEKKNNNRKLNTRFLQNQNRHTTTQHAHVHVALAVCTLHHFVHTHKLFGDGAAFQRGSCRYAHQPAVALCLVILSSKTCLKETRRTEYVFTVSSNYPINYYFYACLMRHSYQSYNDWRV